MIKDMGSLRNAKTLRKVLMGIGPISLFMYFSTVERPLRIWEV